MLHPLAIADLERSGIAAADAERAGLFSVEDASTIYPEFRPLPALVLPYFTPGGEIATFTRSSDTALPFCRVRYLAGISHGGSSFISPKTPQRYTQPKASGVKVYFPPLVDWKTILAKPDEPLLLCEGEKKSISAAVAGFPVVALGGVFNFMSGPALLPELEALAPGRDIYICFDSDAATNPNILAAEARLVDELQVKRGARCYLVRIPQSGEHKVGVDDYLLAHGPAAFLQLLQSAPSLGALDAKVVALNQSVAWISRENLIYDLKTKLFISKDSFVNGEHYGAIKHITVGGTQRSAPKEISVAATWLKHPHAKRFSEVLFRPSQGPTVIGDHGRPALNLWGGFDPGEGSVEPFLQLNKFLFQNLPENLRDLPLKILAYKAQNPQIKVPLALVLLGEQGSGKSLWTECVVEAFAPYGTYLTSRSFYSEFQGWLETSLMAAILEAKPEDLERGSDMLKSLISDLQRPMNEKYRPARLINSYTFYILTSNEKAAGAFSHDDRRMFVIDCPKKRGPEFYKPISEWKNKQGGPKALLGYLLNMDLRGWVPRQLRR